MAKTTRVIMRLSLLLLVIASLGPFSPTHAAELGCQLKNDHPTAEEMSSFQECVRKNLEAASGKGTGTSLQQTTTPQKADTTLLQSTEYVSTSVVKDDTTTPSGEISNCTVAKVILASLQICETVTKEECDQIMRDLDEWLKDMIGKDKGRWGRSLGAAELQYLRNFFDSFEEQCEFQLWKVLHWERIMRPPRSTEDDMRKLLEDYVRWREQNGYGRENGRWGRSAESMREKRQVSLEARRLFDEYQKLRESNSYGMPMSRWGRSFESGKLASSREKRGLGPMKKVDQIQSILDEYLRWHEQNGYGKLNGRWGRSAGVVKQAKQRVTRSTDLEEILKIIQKYDNHRQMQSYGRDAGGGRWGRSTDRVEASKVRHKREVALPSPEELLEMYRQWRQANSYGKVNGRWG